MATSMVTTTTTTTTTKTLFRQRRAQKASRAQTSSTFGRASDGSELKSSKKRCNRHLLKKLLFFAFLNLFFECTLKCSVVKPSLLRLDVWSTSVQKLATFFSSCWFKVWELERLFSSRPPGSDSKDSRNQPQDVSSRRPRSCPSSKDSLAAFEVHDPFGGHGRVRVPHEEEVRPWEGEAARWGTFPPLWTGGIRVPAQGTPATSTALQAPRTQVTKNQDQLAELWLSRSYRILC